MMCVINLYKDDEILEIVTDLDNNDVQTLSNFINKKSWSSEKLVNKLIKEFIQHRS